MCTIYIVENVNDDDNLLKIVSKFDYNPVGFDRIGHILSKLGFNYYNDYNSVKIYKNYLDRNIGDIIEIKNNKSLELYKEYKTDVQYGDYFDNMIIKLSK